MKYQITFTNDDSIVQDILYIETKCHGIRDIIRFVRNSLEEKELCACDACDIFFDGGTMKEYKMDLYCAPCRELLPLIGENDDVS